MRPPRRVVVALRLGVRLPKRASPRAGAVQPRRPAPARRATPPDARHHAAFIPMAITPSPPPNKEEGFPILLLHSPAPAWCPALLARQLSALRNAQACATSLLKRSRVDRNGGNPALELPRVNNERHLSDVITWGAIRWKLRQKYSELRSRLGGGRHFWRVEPGVRFVARSGDAFFHVLFVCGGHEIKEMQWCRRWLAPGDSVIDCGANIGALSATSRKPARWSESSPWRETIARLQCVLITSPFSSSGASRSWKPSSQPAMPIASSFQDLHGREPWQRARRLQDHRPAALVTTLDLLCETHQVRPSLIKIDCEGFETFIPSRSEPIVQRDAARLYRSAMLKHCRRWGRMCRNCFPYFVSMITLCSISPVSILSNLFGSWCDVSFPSAEFNFAAIPNGTSSLERWGRAHARW